METLFSPETVQKFLEILGTAAEGSVTVLIAYFMIPLFMLLVSTLAWTYIGYHFIKFLKVVFEGWFSKEKLVLTKYDLKEHFITYNGEHKIFIDVINKLKGSDMYVREYHIEYLMDALENQIKISANRRNTIRLKDEQVTSIRKEFGIK